MGKQRKKTDIEIITLVCFFRGFVQLITILWASFTLQSSMYTEVQLVQTKKEQLMILSHLSYKMKIHGLTCGIIYECLDHSPAALGLYYTIPQHVP